MGLQIVQLHNVSNLNQTVAVRHHWPRRLSTRLGCRRNRSQRFAQVAVASLLSGCVTPFFVCVLLLLLCGQLKPFSRDGFANCPVAQRVQFEPDGCGATPLAQTFLNTTRVPQKQKSAFRPSRCRFSLVRMCYSFFCVRAVTFVVWSVKTIFS